MKRYEDPIINVSLFDVENIVTSSGAEPASTAVNQAVTAATASYGEENVISFTF